MKKWQSLKRATQLEQRYCEGAFELAFTQRFHDIFQKVLELRENP